MTAIYRACAGAVITEMSADEKHVSTYTSASDWVFTAEEFAGTVGNAGQVYIFRTRVAGEIVLFFIDRRDLHFV